MAMAMAMAAGATTAGGGAAGGAAAGGAAGVLHGALHLEGKVLHLVRGEEHERGVVSVLRELLRPTKPTRHHAHTVEARHYLLFRRRRACASPAVRVIVVVG